MTPAAQRQRRRQLREQTRDQIVAAAQAFLSERPYRELSVDALMAGTGHTRTVFYRHFDDIPSLLLALMADVGGELVEVSREWAGAEVAGPDTARRELARFVAFYDRHGPLVRAVTEAARHDETVEQAYRAMVDGFIALTEQTIQQRIANGELEPIDAHEVARALVWMLNSYLDDTFGRGGTTDPERALDALWTIWSRALPVTQTPDAGA
jgi:AcrR family transcriptional regulator